MRLAVLLLAVLASPARCGQKPIYIDLHDKASRAEPMDLATLKQNVRTLLAKIKNGQLPKIRFDFDSAKIRLESEPTLDAVAALLLQNPDVKLMIRAHTCALGTAQYNLKLSNRRARSVRDYLVKEGVWPTSIRYKGYGYYRPIADNSTEAGREKNRRVEFQFTYRDWDSVF